MTVPSSGDRARRGGRRPGWTLLTVLLALAIAASAALVFTNRVELLKLAVILALWAAVVGAFVSVIYRRQSDVDAARARDMKLVYDLQLDREIAARREYELNVESHVRRELAGEIRAQSADEVASLRAELASLRRSLEILFDADLSQRPAIETDRSFGEWTAAPEPPRLGRVASSRVTEVRYAQDTQTAENPIIDVPEEPLVAAEAVPQPPPPDQRGSHRRRSGDTGWTPQDRPAPVPVAADPVPQQRVRPVTPPPVTPPLVMPPPVTPPPPVFQPPPPPEPVRPATNGRAAGEPLPTPPPPPPPVAAPPAAAPPAAAPPEPDRRGRHAGPAEAPAGQPSPPPAARHRGIDATAATADETAAPAARHRGVDAATADVAGPDQAAAPAGQSVAELLARLQHSGPAQGGRRRRRED